MARILRGTDQADTILASGAGDTIVSGAGHDYLIGAGQNVFAFKPGDGLDWIDNFNPNSDKLQFGGGLTAEDLTFQHLVIEGVPGLAVYYSGIGGPDALFLARVDGISLPDSALIFAPPPQPRAQQDFNGDGRADLIWQHSDGQAAVWFMDGTQLLSGVIIGPNPGADWRLRDSGDIDGDGRADLIWQHSDGQAAVWFMDGTQLLSGVAIGPNPGADWQLRGSDDVDADGRADLIWQHSDGQAVVWFMDGTQPLSSAAIGPNPGADWHLV